MDEFKAVHNGGARRVNLAHGVLFRETLFYTGIGLHRGPVFLYRSTEHLCTGGTVVETCSLINQSMMYRGILLQFLPCFLYLLFVLQVFIGLAQLLINARSFG